MIKYINELKKEDLARKKVLLRVDFDMPLTQSPTIPRPNGPGSRSLGDPGTNHQLITQIGESFRIKAQKETVDYLISAGAKVLMVAHLGHEISNASFELVVEEIGEILGQDVVMVRLKDFLAGNWKSRFDLSNRGSSIAEQSGPETGNLFLLDNIRQDAREVKNDDELARELAAGFDYYVNDAFAAIHRKHASMVAITKYLPSYAGFLIKKEIENLRQAIDAPPEGKVLVLGGAKISTKMPIIKNFIDRADKILVGGALANDFFRAQGINVGVSVVDDSVVPDIKSENIILPRDFVTSTKNGDPKSIKLYKKIVSVGVKEAILDIGPETAEEWAEMIERAKMVIWNGPMGYFELHDFAEGTEVIAAAAVKAEHSIIGGGDTIAAVDKLGLLDKYSFVSTGGGAMLEFLAYNRLPGLEALEYY